MHLHTGLITVVAATVVLAAMSPPVGASPGDEDGLGPCQDAPFAPLALHPRLREHRVDGVRVLVQLPVGYDSTRRYPVLYLLHGSVSVPDEWVTRMGIESRAEVDDVVVVMPDGGRAGGYRDWRSGGRRWESFHTGRLVRWVDETYPTIADRSHRAIAGLSMGGSGALYYAARHPDLFGAAASFSGLPLAWITAPEHVAGATYMYDLQQRCEEDQHGVELFGVYGNPLTDEVGVRNQLPTDVADGLRGSLVYLSSGDGVPVDEEQRALALERPDMAVMEPLIRTHTTVLSERLTELGIDHVIDGLPGAHWWGTFRPGLARFLQLLTSAEGFGRPLPPAFDYRAADHRFTTWDWTFDVTGRPAPGFTRITRASAGGLQLAGTGTVGVRTARLYRPNERLELVVDGEPVTARASADGRLAFRVPLGDDGRSDVRIHRRRH